jgi:hypothetical protein
MDMEDRDFYLCIGKENKMDVIVNGVCTNEGQEQCFQPYACDACPYNLDAEIDSRLEVGL